MNKGVNRSEEEFPACQIIIYLILRDSIRQKWFPLECDSKICAPYDVFILLPIKHVLTLLSHGKLNDLNLCQVSVKYILLQVLFHLPYIYQMIKVPQKFYEQGTVITESGYYCQKADFRVLWSLISSPTDNGGGFSLQQDRVQL